MCARSSPGGTPARKRKPSALDAALASSSAATTTTTSVSTAPSATLTQTQLNTHANSSIQTHELAHLTPVRASTKKHSGKHKKEEENEDGENQSSNHKAKSTTQEPLKKKMKPSPLGKKPTVHSTINNSNTNTDKDVFSLTNTRFQNNSLASKAMERQSQKVAEQMSRIPCSPFPPTPAPLRH